jgi:hypothetical protein
MRLIIISILLLIAHLGFSQTDSNYVDWEKYQHMDGQPANISFEFNRGGLDSVNSNNFNFIVKSLFVRKLVGVGILGGYSFHHSNLIDRKSFSFDNPVYRMVNINFTVGGLIRIGGWGYKHAKSHPNDRFFIETGVKYELPIINKIVTRDTQGRAVARRVGRFNDVKAFASINYKNGGVYAAYRIFNNIENPYPQQATYTIGININFGSWVTSGSSRPYKNETEELEPVKYL